MSYKAIHTNYGLAAIAAAEASGTPINLTHMAVGDGNGNPTTPGQTQTNLVREMYRATVNRVYQSPDDAQLFTAELIVPASVSGFTMREVGIFDSSGGLVVVANIPDTYKPSASEGAFSDAVIRLQFYVSNASVITLVIDPAVAVATHSWIINNITPAYLFPGGTTHQILRKKSNANGDTEWADATDVSVNVDSIEETQTLAAGQTVIDWATVTNQGLAVYIEGVRLRADQFTKHATINTRITLASSYPAGTKCVGTQNEPAGTLTDPLAKNQNLADVLDKAAARTNLDVFNKAETRQMAPAGQAAYFARSTAPTGWLKANGAAVSRTAYADLFAAIGTTFGSGDGVNTFNLPDLRGEFIRGWDDAKGTDAGRTMGSAQGDAIRNITGLFDGNTNDGFTKTGPFYTYQNGGTGADGAGGGGIIGFDASRVVPTANENRPRNVALLACIKY